MDLIIFCVLAAVVEFLSYFLLSKFSSSIYVSFGMLLFIIASVRWGRASIVVLIASSLPLLFLTKMPLLESVLYNVVANAFAAIPIMIYGKKKRDKLYDTNFHLSMYILAVFGALVVGKGLALLLLTNLELGFRNYIGSILLTFIMNAMFLLLLNKMREKLIMDMDEYLERTSKGEVYGQ